MKIPSIAGAGLLLVLGTTPITAGTLVLNEILAVNKTAIENGGSFPDYIEIRNTGATPSSLDGVSLTDDPLTPAKFTFPSGMTLAAGERLVVWCDSEFTSPGLHTGFGLSSTGQTVELNSGATIIDSISFGLQAPDLSIGRIIDGTGSWVANVPTPGAANSAATVAAASTASTTLFINEWMASPAHGDDWFELYNSGTLPLDISQLYLSDDPATPKKTRIPLLSFMSAGGYARFMADDSTGGNHCAFKLSSGGDKVVLTATGGNNSFRTVTFGAQTTGVSQGLLPDGVTGTATSFPTTSSPDKPNWLPAPVVVNEVLAHPTVAGNDAIELYNPTASAVSVAGWWLSDDVATPKKYQIGAGVSVPAGGYLVVTESQLLTGAIPFSFSSTGDEACLSAASGSALTGYRSQVSFGSSSSGVSFGRVPATGLANGSGGVEFWPQVQTTLGAVNSAPVLTPLQINELMYHPVDASGGVDVTDTEYVEIHNPTNATVNLEGWRLKGESDYTFAAGATLAPSGYLLVVSFDPANATALSNFRTTYGLTAATPIYGPYSKALPNSSAVIEIGKPVTIDGVLKNVTVDRVEYNDAAPWPLAPDGAGSTLQRISRSSIGNDAANWGTALPSPGAVNSGLFTTLAVWSESPLPDATQGTAYSFQLTAVGGTPPYTWTVASGSLPAGLHLSSSGLISGTPEGGSSATFTVQLAHAAAGTAQKSFTITGVAANADADNDGMPDDWETANGVSDPAADKDGDGRSNLEEYQAGTDPSNFASRFAVIATTPLGGNGISVTWSAVAGKTYQIYTNTSTTLSPAGWTPQGSAIPCTVTGTLQANVTVGIGVKGFVRIAVEP